MKLTNFLGMPSAFALGRTMATLVGGVIGFCLGGFLWVKFYYIVYMLPYGTPERVIDQGAIPVLITAPVGSIVGALLGRKCAIWFWKYHSASATRR
jgi:hypothetical protein